jgi:hypothetical protein
MRKKMCVPHSHGKRIKCIESNSRRGRGRLGFERSLVSSPKLMITYHAHNIITPMPCIALLVRRPCRRCNGTLVEASDPETREKKDIPWCRAEAVAVYPRWSIHLQTHTHTHTTPPPPPPGAQSSNTAAFQSTHEEHGGKGRARSYHEYTLLVDDRVHLYIDPNKKPSKMMRANE